MTQRSRKSWTVSEEGARSLASQVLCTASAKNTPYGRRKTTHPNQPCRRHAHLKGREGNARCQAQQPGINRGGGLGNRSRPAPVT